MKMKKCALRLVIGRWGNRKKSVLEDWFITQVMKSCSVYEELFSPIAFFSGQGRDRLLGWSFPFGELYSKK